MTDAEQRQLLERHLVAIERALAAIRAALRDLRATPPLDAKRESE